MLFSDFDKRMMSLALAAARGSAEAGEVPVGAVICQGETVLAVAGNHPITTADPTAHAEIAVIREAARKVGNYRLPGTTLYVTLEPCLMCMGAIIHSRIERLVFGARDPKTGAACSKYRIGRDGLLNHTVRIESGLLDRQCGALLVSFFSTRRQSRTESQPDS